MKQSYYLTWCFIIRVMFRPLMVYYKYAPMLISDVCCLVCRSVSPGEQLLSLKDVVVRL